MFTTSGRVAYIRDFKWLHKEKPRGTRSGDLGGYAKLKKRVGISIQLDCCLFIKFLLSKVQRPLPTNNCSY